MLRSAAASALVLLLMSTPSLAADYGPAWMRGSFTSADWQEADQSDALNFELGLRYFYSRGHQGFSVDARNVSGDDTSHILEAHFRVDDPVTRYYVKGLFGYSIAGTATGTTPSGPITTSDGHVGYARADIGYEPYGDPAGNLRFGFLAGYQYWDDSPDFGRSNFTTGTASGDFSFDPATGAIIPPGNSEPDSVIVHALRLGVAGDARLGPLVDLGAQIAAIPYAHVGGTLGAYGVPTSFGPGTTTFQASAADLDGWGYGVMAEAMLGFHPTDNLTLRVGGRAWYLRGWTSTSYDTVTLSDPQDTNADGTYDQGPSVLGTRRYISTDNPFSLFRYGALAELTYNF